MAEITAAFVTASGYDQLYDGVAATLVEAEGDIEKAVDNFSYYKAIRQLSVLVVTPTRAPLLPSSAHLARLAQSLRFPD